MQKNKNVTTGHPKRTGAHQRRTKRFHNTYLPYLPMTIILFLSVFLSGLTPKRATLAYATNVSQSGLLSSTNAERSKIGRGSLTINSALNNAAQSKANDMTKRNYWSHNTPDGQEPWVFVQTAGYSYLKAGENLAYGFTTSSDTIQGWMNSQTHRENMLDPDYTDVGFGFANSSNYNSAGEETVVVAMYGKPQVAAAVQNATNAVADTNPAPKESISQAPSEPQTPTEQVKVTPTNNSRPEKINSTNEATANQEQEILISKPKQVSRIESLTKGRWPWALSAVSFMLGIAIVLVLARHGLALRKLLKDSEKFVLHHPLFDSTIFALIVLGLTLSRTVGFIR